MVLATLLVLLLGASGMAAVPRTRLRWPRCGDRLRPPGPAAPGVVTDRCPELAVRPLEAGQDPLRRERAAAGAVPACRTRGAPADAGGAPAARGRRAPRGGRSPPPGTTGAGPTSRCHRTARTCCAATAGAADPRRSPRSAGPPA